MHIERKYYTAAKQFMDEVQREVELNQTSLTTAEKIEANKHRAKKLRQLITKIEEGWSKHPRIPNSAKLSHFQKIMNDSIWLAANCELNVCIDLLEERLGSIQLESDFLLIDDLCPSRSRSIFQELFTTATEFTIVHTNLTFILTFCFDLFDTL